MTKYEFLYKLEHALKGLPQKEVNEHIAFYSEMIDDLIEEGLSEENAIEKIGTAENIASQITEEIPLGKIIIEKVKPKRKLTALEIILLIVGSPIWGAILISLFAVFFFLYACLWAVIVSLWTVGVCLPIFAIACVIMGVITLISGNGTITLLFLSGSLILAGLSMLYYAAVKPITKGMAFLTAKTTKLIKNAFISKENINE